MHETTRRALRDGVIAGLILYASVAAFFLVVNLAAGRPPFLTAALLGGALFGGLRDPAQLALEPGWIVSYNAVGPRDRAHHLYPGLPGGQSCRTRLEGALDRRRYLGGRRFRARARGPGAAVAWQATLP